ncbi:MAG: hypothetical protein ABEJ42_04860 [Halobacteriaceae archaeon]
MVTSPKTGQELEPETHHRGPEWLRRNYARVGLAPDPDSRGDRRRVED